MRVGMITEWLIGNGVYGSGRGLTSATIAVCVGGGRGVSKITNEPSRKACGTGRDSNQAPPEYRSSVITGGLTSEVSRGGGAVGREHK
jgi:hypothetical protein